MADDRTESTTPPAYRVHGPDPATGPVLLSSPHSGAHYPPDFLGAARLGHDTLRRMEDMLVDQLVAPATQAGVTMIAAVYGRAYVDLNRAPDELDPALFHDAPHTLSTAISARVRAGLGVIPRIAGGSGEIYGERQSYASAQARLAKIYRPFHDRLAGLIDASLVGHGHAILLDFHSMPASTAPRDRNNRAADIVLGDRHSRSAAPELVRLVAQCCADLGFVVALNTPYSGGFITEHHGRPAEGRHVVQVELNRALYMDEARLVATAGLTRLRAKLVRLISDIVEESQRLVLAPQARLAAE